MSGTEDDIVDTMDLWLQARLEELHTTLPGVIQAYDPDTRLATVVPTVRLQSLHGDSLEIKPIAAVPVVFPSCARFSLIPANLQPGDGVLLHFSEASLGNWINGSGTVNAEDETRFSLHDCIAVSGLYSSRTAPKHDLGGADFGLAGDQGEVLGAKDGKLDLRNTDTDLRTVLEAILDLLPSMDAALVRLNAVGAVYTTQNLPVVGEIPAAQGKIEELLR